jgi:hypothetical protein
MNEGGILFLSSYFFPMWHFIFPVSLHISFLVQVKTLHKMYHRYPVQNPLLLINTYIWASIFGGVWVRGCVCVEVGASVYVCVFIYVLYVHLKGK